MPMNVIDRKRWTIINEFDEIARIFLSPPSFDNWTMACNLKCVLFFFSFFLFHWSICQCNCQCNKWSLIFHGVTGPKLNLHEFRWMIAIAQRCSIISIKGYVCRQGMRAFFTKTILVSAKRVRKKNDMKFTNFQLKVVCSKWAVGTTHSTWCPITHTNTHVSNATRFKYAVYLHSGRSISITISPFNACHGFRFCHSSFYLHASTTNAYYPSSKGMIFICVCEIVFFFLEIFHFELQIGRYETQSCTQIELNSK